MHNYLSVQIVIVGGRYLQLSKVPSGPEYAESKMFLGPICIAVCKISGSKFPLSQKEILKILSKTEEFSNKNVDIHFPW